MEKILEDAPISYIKWDMNRCMSEVYSHTASAADQGKVMHQYILGVYRLYEKLTADFLKFYLNPVQAAVPVLIRDCCIMRRRHGHRMIRMQWNVVRSSMERPLSIQ